MKHTFAAHRRLRIAASFSLLALVLSCRSQGNEAPQSEVAPTKIATQGSKAAQRSIECETALANDDFDALTTCLAEDFEYRDNVGTSVVAADGFLARERARSERRRERERRPLVVVADGEQAFSLWVETGRYSGRLEGQRIEDAPYGILGASRWSQLDEEGRFHALFVYEDPNMLLHQVGEAPRTSHERFELPEAEPVLVERDDRGAAKAVTTVQRRVQATNDHDLEALARTYADDVVGISTSNVNDARTRAGVLAGVPQGWAVYPNLNVEIERLWGAGDWVVLEGVFSGTNTGDLGSGVGATNASFEQPFVEFIEVTNGEVSRYWRVVDSLAVARQLGLLDGPSDADVDADDTDPAGSSTDTDDATGEQ